MFRPKPNEGSDADAERRRAERIEQVPLEARGAANGTIHDISRTGVAIQAREPLEIGTVVEIDLVDRPTGLACPFRARVVWCRGGRVGLEFIGMTPEQDGWLAARFVEWLTQAAGF